MESAGQSQSFSVGLSFSNFFQQCMLAGSENCGKHWGAESCAGAVGFGEGY